MATSYRNALGIAVLDFIDQTSRFEAEFKRRRENGQLPPAVMRMIEMELSESPTQIVVASRQIINACLADIGGIRSVLEDPATGQQTPCLYLGWQGNHPTEEGMHLWKARLPQGLGVVSISANALEEFSNLFLEN